MEPKWSTLPCPEPRAQGGTNYWSMLRGQSTSLPGKELTQIMVANNFVKPAQGVGEGLSKRLGGGLGVLGGRGGLAPRRGLGGLGGGFLEQRVRSTRCEDPPRGDRKVRRSESNTEAVSRSDSKTVASGVKPLAKAATALEKVIPEKSITQISSFVAKEQIRRYQTPFTPEIEGMDPLGKFTRPKLTLYDGKLDSRSHISHFRQMMALWNHLDALMCRVFLSSMGDLDLKWSDKLPVGSIGSFYQLTGSFVARFIINTKAMKIG
ncbi:hypothetical protein Acr_28g0001910 [Actinidia rufa]|uniref:Uncharacterized protein n=1 Tax=Actinidia rufa TaxID=165716 RepID=A0A7J0H8T2_9ERIC|nr:hypothetical protein Acr_28g0001910 [Actinidia rufa]